MAYPRGTTATPGHVTVDTSLNQAGAAGRQGVDRPAHRLAALMPKRQVPRRAGTDQPSTDKESMSEHSDTSARRRAAGCPGWSRVSSRSCAARSSRVLPYVRGVSNRADAAAAAASTPSRCPSTTRRPCRRRDRGRQRADLLAEELRRRLEPLPRRVRPASCGTDHEADKATTAQRLTSQKVDLVATVQHSAFESADEQRRRPRPRHRRRRRRQRPGRTQRADAAAPGTHDGQVRGQVAGRAT